MISPNYDSSSNPPPEPDHEPQSGFKQLVKGIEESKKNAAARKAATIALIQDAIARRAYTEPAFIGAMRDLRDTDENEFTITCEKIALGGGADVSDIVAAMTAAPKFAESATGHSEADKRTEYFAESTGTSVEIVRLAQLSEFEFAVGRKQFAKSMKIGVAQLQKIVDRVRKSVRDDKEPSYITRLNREYAHILIGSKARIVTTTKGGYYRFLEVSAFHSHFASDLVPVDGKWYPISSLWMKDHRRNSFTDLEFAPGRILPEGVLNIWRGMNVEPIVGMSNEQAAEGCSLLLNHIRDNICSNAEEYAYFINWCADLVQFPGMKSGVAVSIKGEKGTGKSKVGETLVSLFGPHAFTANSERHLTGNFNAHLGQAVFVLAEEAIWAGNKSAEGTLKHMITSHTAPLEKKGIDVIEVDSYCHLMFIGNADWLFPATGDERRLFALECGEEQMQKDEYFAAIDLQLYGHKGGFRGNPDHWKQCFGIRSFLTFLLSVDLSNFNIRKIPLTDALRNQIAAGMKPHEQYFYNCLSNGTIGRQEKDSTYDDYEDRPWTEEGAVIRKRSLYQDFMITHEKRGHHLIAENAFGRFIKHVFGWGETKKDNRPVWKVTGIADSRARWEALMKVKIDNPDAF